jgi:hypothetical protein
LITENLFGFFKCYNIPLWYSFMEKIGIMARIRLPSTIFFQFFPSNISRLLPYAYAVRLGSKKKCIFEKRHGKTIFTDPTFDLFFRRGYYHFSF